MGEDRVGTEPDLRLNLHEREAGLGEFNGWVYLRLAHTGISHHDSALLQMLRHNRAMDPELLPQFNGRCSGFVPGD